MVERVTHAAIKNPSRHANVIPGFKAGGTIYTGDVVYITADNTVTAYGGGAYLPIGIAQNPAVTGEPVGVAVGGIVKVWASNSKPMSAGFEVAASQSGTLAGGVYGDAGGVAHTVTAPTIIGTIIDDLGSSQIVYVVLRINRRHANLS